MKNSQLRLKEISELPDITARRAAGRLDLDSKPRLFSISHVRCAH